MKANTYMFLSYSITQYFCGLVTGTGASYDFAGAIEVKLKNMGEMGL